MLSNGRLLFGIGGGWNAEEMENHGTDFRRRWKLLRERIEAMKVIWTQDSAEYHGELVNFDPIWSWPKPTQQPHPPIVLGAHGARGRQRVARYCDGWMPIPGRAADLKVEIGDLRAQAETAGRDPRSLTVSLFGVSTDEKALQAFADAGADRVIFALPPAGRDTVLRKLDRASQAMAALA